MCTPRYSQRFLVFEAVNSHSEATCGVPFNRTFLLSTSSGSQARYIITGYESRFPEHLGLSLCAGRSVETDEKFGHCFIVDNELFFEVESSTCCTGSYDAFP